MSNLNKHSIPQVQRALVLQGGGALGAYQVGVFKSLYEKILEIQDVNNEKDVPLFDIIAGTSIGAINAAILVSYFVENKTWNGASEKLEAFWKYLSTPTPNISKALKLWKKEHDKGNPLIASEESARRYYSVKEFSKSGVENVFKPINPPKQDNKFCDSQNQWLLYDNKPLRKSIEKFAKFPIASSFDKGQPRLLVVSVDAAEGTSVTFDSYESQQGKRESEYGDSHLGKSIVIQYNEGIDIKHLIASSSLPEVYAYEDVDGRMLWDGGLLSNTPVKELIEAHQRFWEKRIGSKNLEDSFRAKITSKEMNNNYLRKSQEQKEPNPRIPDLEIYIVNLLDPKQNSNNSTRNMVPQDFDGVKGRHIDIKLGKAYDTKTDGLHADYVNLIEKLIALGDNDELLKEKINILLEEYTPRRFITEEVKRNIDILKNTFKITKIIQIQRKDDINSVSGKLADFTSETIERLIREGYQDALSK
ncbi:MAG TPA: patatin-like phospholipase family protein [Candidatus Nitrosocosmicus sp.]|nr:patatin-like phospholipase family protein [Candidatus Nitrosocosmicus sp.]